MDQIILDVEGKLWAPGQKKIMGLTHTPLKFRERMMKLFVPYMVTVYQEELVRAIEMQRYKAEWKPLHPDYLDYKKKMDWSLKIWQRTGLLKDSITYWKTEKPVKGWTIGIDPEAYYEPENEGEKRIQVRLVAFWMEYGTGEKAEDKKGKKGWPGMPARPLFRPLREYLRKHVDVYYGKFLREQEEDIDEALSMTVLEELESVLS